MTPLGRTLTLLLPVAAACADAPAPPREAATSASAMFRGGPAHLGVYDVRPVRRFGGLRWRFRTGGPVRSSPAIAGDVVYIGSSDGTLYALDLATGIPRWSRPLGSAVTSSPAVGSGLVYAQTRNGDVFALRADGGDVAWRASTGADVPFAWPFTSGDIYVSSPVLAAGRVLVGGGDGGLHAFDARTGEEEWSAPTEGRVRSSPAVANGRAYVGSADGSVYAFDVESGRRAWRFDTFGRTLDSDTFGFDRKTVQSSPAVADGLVYVGARDGFLYAIDADSGAMRWRFDHQVSWVNSSPAVAGGLVFDGSSDGHFVQAVDAVSGRERWRFTTPASVWSSPAVAGGVVYVGDGAGDLLALDAQRGDTLWSFRAGGGVRDAPAAADGVVVFGSEDGGVYAVAGGARALQRVVFWDSAYVRSAWTEDHVALRDGLVQRGFARMDAASLGRWMAAESASGEAAADVVVFALDHLAPPLLASDSAGTPLLRRFLEAGGTVVWPGVPPVIWPRDPKTGEPGPYARMDHEGAARLLDVDFAAARFDRVGAAATAAGRRWGLEGWWTSGWGVAPTAVDEVLATDENGLATAWVKGYAGGGRFVLVGRGSDRGDRLDAVTLAALYRPVSGAAPSGR